MKTEMEVLDGVLVIKNEQEGMKAVIDIPTGEVLFFEHPEASIMRLRMFTNKVYARYMKFLSSKAVEDYTN